MANAQYTMAQLVGTGGTLSFVGHDELVDRQRFAFPGIGGVYVTSLGWRGSSYRCQGILRATGANQQAAATAFKAQLAFIYAAHRAGTIFDLFHGETTAIKKLMEDAVGNDMTNLIVDEFKIVSPRYFVAAQLAVIADYEMTLMRVGT